MHGEVKAAAQIREGLQCLQTLACLGGEMHRRRSQKVAERLLITAPHPASHLVQVAQSEVVCIVDDNGIGVRNIDTVLHDGSREQYVVVEVDEPHHHLLQLLGFHLSMTDGHACIRHIFPDHQSQFRQVTDPVVHEEHLSVSAHLELDGIGNHLFVEGMHLGIDGIAVRRRSLYDTHVARPHQRELQRSRYWCGRHGERVHIGLHLAQLLLRRNAELLFLIDDKQSEVLELHRLPNELMRTDNDIYLPLLQVTENLLGLLGAPCP